MGNEQKGYAVQEFVGDYPIERQQYWGTFFSSLKAAKLMAVHKYSEFKEGHPYFNMYSHYYVVVTDAFSDDFGKTLKVAGESEEMELIVHKGKQIEGVEACRKWEENHHTMIHGE